MLVDLKVAGRDKRLIDGVGGRNTLKVTEGYRG